MKTRPLFLEALGRFDDTEVSLHGYIPHLLPNFFEGGWQYPLPSFIRQGYLRAGQLDNIAVGNSFLIRRCVWEPRTGLHKQQEACVSIYRKTIVWGDWGCSSHDKIQKTEYGWLSWNPCVHHKNMELSLTKFKFCRLRTENKHCLQSDTEGRDRNEETSDKWISTRWLSD